ncbi:thioredoxin domain-containing protein [Caenimonas terrae]|uniref:Thioredoxin domain-containing protein n=1 Tax=Caenimonas terrae TaxID=696074 RepID=A0ABW0N987_9BURK
MTGDDDKRWVFGLCADWCGVCKEWRAAFDAAAASHRLDRFAWVDIEDEDDLVGDVDIETFPTLLVGRGARVLFFGPILPAPDLLARLLASLDGSGSSSAPPEAAALLQRLVSAQL